MSVPPTRLADLVQRRHIGEAIDLERKTVTQAAGDADGLLAEAIAAAAALWVHEFGGIGATGTGEALGRLLRQAATRMQKALEGLGDRARRAILAALPQAITLGVDHARALVKAAGRRAGRNAGAGAKAGKALTKEARQLPGLVDDAIAKATALLAARPDRFPQVAAAMNVARGAVSRIKSGVAWLVHKAVDAGAGQVAADLGLGRLWIAEPDACVRCAAYSGEYAAPGDPFDGGLSLDSAQRGHGPEEVDGPPLHPHCRCRTVPWSMRWPIRLPELLRQRAARAVAEGQARPSESQAARVRAAQAVLASGRRLPGAVAEQARHAVREGRFPPRPAA